jgi:AbrB family looped-hinge helix DNA binding protein
MMVSMTTTLTLDKAGRVVLPKPVRDELQLRAGDALELESSEDRIVLRPQRGGLGLRKKQGIWVFSTGEPISAEATDETLRQIRREREQNFRGSSAAHTRRRKKIR